jgi:hypothetical protein
MTIIRMVPFRAASRILVTLSLAVALAALAMAPARNARAATLVVTDCTTYAAAGGLGPAIASAASDGIADTIVFACSMGAPLAIPVIAVSAADGPLTIDGTGQIVSLSGSLTNQLFTVGAGASLELRNLSLFNGLTAAHGGAILNSGQLTVADTLIAASLATVGGGLKNEAGAIAALTRTTFSGNLASGIGGAVMNAGVLSVQASSFLGSRATIFGGGIYNDSTGTLTVTNSFFFDNATTRSPEPAKVVLSTTYPAP